MNQQSFITKIRAFPTKGSFSFDTGWKYSENPHCVTLRDNIYLQMDSYLLGAIACALLLEPSGSELSRPDFSKFEPPRSEISSFELSRFKVSVFEVRVFKTLLLAFVPLY